MDYAGNSDVLITCQYCLVQIKPGRAYIHLTKCPAYRKTLKKLQRQCNYGYNGHYHGVVPDVSTKK